MAADCSRKSCPDLWILFELVAWSKFVKINGAGDCAGLLSVKAPRGYSSEDDVLFAPICPPLAGEFYQPSMTPSKGSAD